MNHAHICSRHLPFLSTFHYFPLIYLPKPISKQFKSHTMSRNSTSNAVSTSHSSEPNSQPNQRSLLWFRKGLRLHDNPSLHFACKDAKHVFPVFILDPSLFAPDPNAPSPGSKRIGINRIAFLLESLKDLDESLKMHGSRLLILKGNPKLILPHVLNSWKISKLCFEYDTEPYSLELDDHMRNVSFEKGIEIFSPVSHTLFKPAEIIAKNNGTAPLTYQSFLKLLPKPTPSVRNLPNLIPPPDHLNEVETFPVPSLSELGYGGHLHEVSKKLIGGETEGLKILKSEMERKKWVAEFEKPKGDPTAFLKPATTTLSPYIMYGCVSVRLLYENIQRIYCEIRTHSKPPVSLEGQLLWREFFYTVGFHYPEFERMRGSVICKQIAWRKDEEMFVAWRDAATGYPWIDAAMTQLRKCGWMHHLARHAVACFLTRGDLFITWEKGRDVFDRLLLDSDWSINNANWLWLSASAFFHQYHRIYSPITFAKKYDVNGKYIRHFLPVLKDFPSKYIYEPWTAPLEVQKKANCIVGKDYPYPIVDHADESKLCKNRMFEAYELNKKNANPSDEDLANLYKTFFETENKKQNLGENASFSPQKRQKKLSEFGL